MSPSDGGGKCALCKKPIKSSDGGKYTIALEAGDEGDSEQALRVPVCRTCWDNLCRDF